MKYIDWDEDKNQWLIAHRAISFDMCLVYIEQGTYLDIVRNHPPYEHQNVFIIEIDNYVYEVPFVEDGKKIFLKTVYPSRVATKKYLK